MTRYEIECFGQNMSSRYVVYADSDEDAQKLAEKHHRPYFADGTWFGSTSILNVKTAKRYTLFAGKEANGWQNDPKVFAKINKTQFNLGLRFILC